MVKIKDLLYGMMRGVKIVVILAVFATVLSVLVSETFGLLGIYYELPQDCGEYESFEERSIFTGKGVCSQVPNLALKLTQVMKECCNCNETCKNFSKYGSKP